MDNMQFKFKKSIFQETTTLPSEPTELDANGAGEFGKCGEGGRERDHDLRRRKEDWMIID